MASSDYISREALLSATDGYDWQAGLKTVLKRIPSANVRPVVRGVWVKNGWSIRCSICGYDMPFATRNFCPNCGADMREANDEKA